MEISPVKPDRSKIDLCDEAAVKQWTKRLGKTKEEIAAAMEKVGPSFAAVRKELGLTDEASSA